jgi:DNA-directed RNA polymerase sigma subunit (sigma70/sigma32)
MNPKLYHFAEVGRNQVYLTAEEEIKLVTEYKKLSISLRKLVLKNSDARQWLLDTYHRVRKEGKSVAKLSARFNNGEQGLNAAIEKEMIAALEPVKGDPAEVMYELNLSDWCISEMLKVQGKTTKTDTLLERLGEIEDVLMRSMLMAAHEIAIQSSSNILSIDPMDAAQEVCLYFLDAIRKYDPDYRTAQGERVKLMTYAYNRASKLIQEWILNNSRLVRVPRSKMERILIVIKAYDTLIPCGVDLEALTNESNNILAERRGTLTETNTFTIKEVDGLIKILMSNYVHLDQPYGGTRYHHRSNSVTIGEMLSDDAASASYTLEVQDDKAQLIEMIQDRLTPLEYQIIMIRYFHKPIGTMPRALADVSELLTSLYGDMNCIRLLRSASHARSWRRKYSRESIRKIEKVALDKLKDVKEVQALWLN